MEKYDIRTQVVVMCGISGSGKTQFSLRLVEEGSFTRLSTDALIWEKAGNKLSILSKEEQKKLFADCQEEVFKQFRFLLEAGKKIVVDATHCKRKVRDRIRHECAEMGVNPVFIYCFAEKEELKRRLSQRKGLDPDDLIVTEDEFHNYWLGFERPEEDETDIIFRKTD